MFVGVPLMVGLVPQGFFENPAPGLFRNKSKARTLVCERISPATGKQRYPGLIETSGPRGDFFERSTVVCKERLLRPGLRAPQDDAILSELDARVTRLAGTVSALRPDLRVRTWLVETHYPSAQVAGKISFAAKNALAAQGLSVSDRTPMLAAGDVGVLTRMPAEDAYPSACKRYAATRSLGADDALLAVINLDPRETALHAGLCVDGQWTWLQ